MACLTCVDAATDCDLYPHHVDLRCAISASSTEAISCSRYIAFLSRSFTARPLRSQVIPATHTITVFDSTAMATAMAMAMAPWNGNGDGDDYIEGEIVRLCSRRGTIRMLGRE
jgi:hypothetical protein